MYTQHAHTPAYTHTNDSTDNMQDYADCFSAELAVMSNDCA